ncbi:MAG: hypothetical protein DLM52_10810, partial [Chthoniobacterales bacterium]
MNGRTQAFVTLALCAVLAACTAGAKKKHYSESAEHAYKAGEYDTARIEYLNLLRVDPQNARAFAQLGSIWLEDGAPLRAGAFLLKALELVPEDDVTRRKLARVYLLVGRAAEARKEALILLDKAPGDGEALILLADASQKPEDLGEAEKRLASFPDKQSVYFHLATAGLAAKKSDATAVEPALKAAVAADPNLPVAHVALGAWYRARRDFKQAGAEFEKASQTSPLRSSERMSLPEYKVQIGELQEAEAILKKMTNQAPDFLPAWSLLARIANREKKYDDSLKLIENSLTRDPNNIEARVVQAESWLGKSETKKALDSLDNLNHAYPQTPMIKYALARAYLQGGNVNQAIAELDEVVRLSPGFVEAVLLHAELHLRNGEASTIVPELEGLSRVVPDLPAPKVLLAEAYRMLGRLDDAAALIQEQIKRAPQNSSYQAMLGLILKQQNKTDAAQKSFEKAMALDPANALAVEQLIDLDIGNKNYAEAHRRLEQFRQKQPNGGTAYYLEGKVAAAEGKFDVAQSALFKALEADPNETRVYDLLLPIYSRANKLPDALARLNDILAKKPDDARALLMSGMIYDQLKDVAKAREAYEKVLTLAPNSISALNNLAYLYGEKLNDLNRAAELAQKARALAPGDPAVLDTLGWIMYRQGDYQQATDLLGQSAAKSPERAEIQYHLGMASYMMGRRDEARAALEKSVSSEEQFAGKDEARRRLSLLTDNNTAQTVGAAELQASLKQQPDDPLLLLRLGEAYERDGAAGKAAEAFERAFTINPKLTAAAMKLAQLNAGPLHNPEKALQFAQKARELSPGDAKASALVGVIALQLKNTAWAYSLLQESARDLPHDATVLHDFAWAAYNLGKVPEARDAMQRSLDAGPGGPT